MMPNDSLSPLNPLYQSQIWLLEKIQYLGYDIDLTGLCFGISNMARQAYLAGEIDKFGKRIRYFQYLSANELNLLKHNKIGGFLIDNEGSSSWELWAFLDGVCLYQTPSQYRHLFKNKGFSQLERAAITLITPSQMEHPEKRMYQSPQTFSGIYTRVELHEFINSLATHLSVPVSFILNSHNHSVSLNFEPSTKQWLLIDPNKLPGIKFDDPSQNVNTEDLVNQLIHSFNASGNHVGFAAELFVNKTNQTQLRKDLKILSDYSPWQAIHQTNLKSKEYKNNWLHLAVAHGEVDTIDKLINAGTDINCKLNANFPLGLACKIGQFESVNQLIEANLANSMKSAMEKASFINEKNDKGETPLFLAIISEYAEIVEYLIANGAEIDEPANDGTTPLLLAIQLANYEIVELLIENEANVNLPNNQDHPILMASYQGCHDILTLLIKHGANVNELRENGDTPIFVAIAYRHYDVIEVLLQNGADINWTNNAGDFPLKDAIMLKDNKIINLLIEYGADITKPLPGGFSLLYLAALQGLNDIPEILIDKTNINQIQGNGETVLHAAIETSNINLVQQLISKGAVLMPRKSDGLNPLFMAIFAAKKDIINLILTQYDEHRAFAYEPEQLRQFATQLSDNKILHRINFVIATKQKTGAHSMAAVELIWIINNSEIKSLIQNRDKLMDLDRKYWKYMKPNHLINHINKEDKNTNDVLSIQNFFKKI